MMLKYAQSLQNVILKGLRVKPLNCLPFFSCVDFPQSIVAKTFTTKTHSSLSLCRNYASVNKAHDTHKHFWLSVSIYIAYFSRLCSLLLCVLNYKSFLEVACLFFCRKYEQLIIFNKIRMSWDFPDVITITTMTT